MNEPDKNIDQIIKSDLEAGKTGSDYFISVKSQHQNQVPAQLAAAGASFSRSSSFRARLHLT